MIIHAYQKELVNQKLDTLVSEKEINQYFEDNKTNFILDQDIVAVNFIKLNKEVPYLWKMRSLFTELMKRALLIWKTTVTNLRNPIFLKDNWQYLNDVLLSLPKDFRFRIKQYLRRNLLN